MEKSSAIILNTTIKYYGKFHQIDFCCGKVDLKPTKILIRYDEFMYAKFKRHTRTCRVEGLVKADCMHKKF